LIPKLDSKVAQAGVQISAAATVSIRPDVLLPNPAIDRPNDIPPHPEKRSRDL
jgi:hypothetical protein